jgi:hypothetical protein
MSGSKLPGVPPWVPREALAELDVSELADDTPRIREQCARLSAVLSANVAAYRRDASGQPGGLCSRYRAADLTPPHIAELARAEQTFPEVAFVAYGRPLQRL